MKYFDFCKTDCTKYKKCKGKEHCTGWTGKPVESWVANETVRKLKTT